MIVAKESLRDEQKRLARERIVDAAAEEIVTKGLDQLSMPAVAETAGVSLRTVYNYFESRDALLEAVPALASERLESAGAISFPERLEDLPAAIRHNWPLFGALDVLGDASSVVRLRDAMAHGRSSTGTTNSELDRELRAGFSAITPELSPVQQDAVFAVIRMMVSSEGFYRVRQQGVGTDESAEVTAWAFQLLLRALVDGDQPFSAPS